MQRVVQIAFLAPPGAVRHRGLGQLGPVGIVPIGLGVGRIAGQAPLNRVPPFGQQLSAPGEPAASGIACPGIHQPFALRPRPKMYVDQPKVNRKTLVDAVEAEDPGRLEVAAVVEIAVVGECPPCDQCPGDSPNLRIVAERPDDRLDNEPFPYQKRLGLRLLRVWIDPPSPTADRHDREEAYALHPSPERPAPGGLPVDRQSDIAPAGPTFPRWPPADRRW